MKLEEISVCDRVEFIESICRGKDVLHLGCADAPFTADLLAKGALLHQRLMPVADELVGVDLSSEGIALMREAGIGNLVVLDSEDPLHAALGRRFDVVVAGELIEHVLNAGLLLESIKTVMHADSVLVLTSPNFCPIKRVIRLVARREEVHPDHICYYSRATLTRLLAQTGLEPIEWRVHWWDVGAISRLSNVALRRLPFMRYYADTLCVTARLAASSAAARAVLDARAAPRIAAAAGPM